MLLPLLWIAVAAGPKLDVEQLQSQCQGQLETLRQRSQDEAALLNQSLTLPKLSIWDGERSDWRLPDGKAEQPAATKVRILHLFSDRCSPCKEEFPLIREMDRQLRADYKGEVQFVYVTVANTSPESLKSFIAEHQERAPVSALYSDQEQALSRAITDMLPPQSPPAAPASASVSPHQRRELPLPVTLILDEEGSVRQSFLGSIVSRRPELISGVAQIYRWSKLHEGLHSPSPPNRPSKLVAKRPRPEP